MIINNLLSSTNNSETNQEALDEINTKIDSINTNVQWLVNNHGTDECPECPELPASVTGTAQAAHVLAGQTFLNNNYGNLITGNMVNNGDVSNAIELGQLKAGFTSGGIIENLTAENIKKDVTIGGITGTLESGYDDSVFELDFYKYVSVTRDPSTGITLKELVYGDTEGYTFYPPEGYLFDTISVKGSFYCQGSSNYPFLNGWVVAPGRYLVSCYRRIDDNGVIQEIHTQLETTADEPHATDIKTVKKEAQYTVETSRNQIRVYDSSTIVNSDYIGAIAKFDISVLLRPISL